MTSNYTTSQEKPMGERMHYHAYHNTTKEIVIMRMSSYYLMSYLFAFHLQMMKKNRTRSSYNSGLTHITSARREAYGGKMDDVW